MKKILAITNFTPISANQGGNPRFYEICKRLRKSNQVDLLLIRKNSNSADLSLVEDGFDKKFKYEFEFKYEGIIEKVFRYLALLLGFYPGIADKSQILKLNNYIEELLRRNKYDAIYVDGIFCASLLHKNILRQVHIDLCDSLCKLKLRELTNQKTLRKKLAFIHEIISLFVLEIKYIYLAKSISFISTDEIRYYNLLVKIIKLKNKISIVRQGVDTEEFNYSPITHKSKLLFFGAYGYTPNIDAAIYLAKDIFPLIKDKLPYMQLMIVGKSPTSEVLELAKNYGIEVYPDVPAILPFLSTAMALVVPLRFGTGVKNKILAAILAGRPVITSKIGIEGLEEKIKQYIYLANTPDEYLAQLEIILLSDLEELNSRLKFISDYIREEYNWDKSSEDMKSSLYLN